QLAQPAPLGVTRPPRGVAGRKSLLGQWKEPATSASAKRRAVILAQRAPSSCLRKAEAVMNQKVRITACAIALAAGAVFGASRANAETVLNLTDGGLTD